GRNSLSLPELLPCVIGSQQQAARNSQRLGHKARKLAVAQSAQRLGETTVWSFPRAFLLPPLCPRCSIVYSTQINRPGKKSVFGGRPGQGWGGRNGLQRLPLLHSAIDEQGIHASAHEADASGIRGV